MIIITFLFFSHFLFFYLNERIYLLFTNFYWENGRYGIFHTKMFQIEMFVLFPKGGEFLTVWPIDMRYYAVYPNEFCFYHKVIFRFTTMLAIRILFDSWKNWLLNMILKGTKRYGFNYFNRMFIKIGRAKSLTKSKFDFSTRNRKNSTRLQLLMSITLRGI